MAELVPASPHASPGSLLAWVDEIADRFETDWKNAQRPSIREYLGTATGESRRELLEELIQIDLEYRWQNGERRRLEDYQRDFPEVLHPDGGFPDHLVLRARQIEEYFASKECDTSPTGKSPKRGMLPPPRDTEIRLQCPHCHNSISGLTVQDREVTCPNCRNSFRLEPGSGEVLAGSALPRMLGPFQLLELLGSGSFGSVYKARDAELERWVAIKVPRAGYFASAEEESRFLREAQSVARLTHPSIVPVYTVAHQDSMPYIVSAFVQGKTLAQVLSERRLGYRETAELTAQVAEALDYAHQNKIIHRDIKPQNILIDAAGRPHLTDFGLARQDEGSIRVTLDGQVLGTPAYMAPEQAAGQAGHADGRSDIYGLGVMLYEMLTGELPFRGNLRMVLHQVLNEEAQIGRAHV